MRVQARRALLVDSAIGVALAVASWTASFYVWGRPDFDRPAEVLATHQNVDVA